MLSHSYPCSAEDIKYLNQQKEYTLISTQLLQQIFIDPRLNDHAIKCWQVLFNKVRFQNNLEITISYNNLAEELGRSKRTIIRYVKLLEQCGYLQLISNFSPIDGQQSNTLFIRVPKSIIDKIKISKNRDTTKKTANTNEVLNIFSINTNKENSAELNNKIISKSIEQPPSPKTESINIHNCKDSENLVIENSYISKIENAETKNLYQEVAVKNAIYSETIQNKAFPENDIAAGESENLLKKKKRFSCYNTNLSKQAQFLPQDLVTSLSRGASDKNVIQYNNIKINNNNNTVVFPLTNQLYENQPSEKPESLFYKTQQTIALLKTEINRLIQLDKTEGVKLKEFIGDNAATYEHLNYLGSIRSKIDSLQTEVIKLKHELDKEDKANTTKININYIFEEPGGKCINTFSFKRLVKNLESYGYSNVSLTTLINEIIFEVKFGSLTKSKTGKEISTDHAINIALKLVREKRWTTPVLFKDKYL
jgi:hypothetical protein